MNKHTRGQKRRQALHTINWEEIHLEKRSFLTVSLCLLVAVWSEVNAVAAGQITLIFGNQNFSSMAGSSGTKFDVGGSRFILENDANITTISCLMENNIDPSQPNASYSFRFAIYRDYIGLVGNLVSQTEIGVISGHFWGVWKTLYFTQPVHLNAGAYWLIAVHNASQFLGMHKALSTGDEKVVESL